jgi:hypothetical protein
MLLAPFRRFRPSKSLRGIQDMGSRLVVKILLIVMLILLATPLLGALAMMATGSSMMAQIPTMMNGRMMGLATIWIALLLLLIYRLNCVGWAFDGQERP